jgi:photosystem II stability/assembly factor-like uncharacterized protein
MLKKSRVLIVPLTAILFLLCTATAHISDGSSREATRFNRVDGVSGFTGEQGTLDENRTPSAQSPVREDESKTPQDKQGTALRPRRGFVSALAIDPFKTNTLYAGTQKGVFKSTDAGASWTAVNSGLANTDVLALAIDPKRTRTLYAGTRGGAFKSTDGGGRWYPMENGLPHTDVLAIAVDPAKPRTVYLIARDAAFVFGVSVEDDSRATYHAGARDCAFKSTNGGVRWSSIVAEMTGYTLKLESLAIDPLKSEILYAGTHRGVFKSTDGGVNWPPAAEATLTEHCIGALAIDPRRPKIVYAGTKEGVFKSTDRGASWSAAGNGINKEVLSLTIDPRKTSTLYAGTKEGVFKSNDGGTSWLGISNSLTECCVNSLAIDFNNNDILYAGADKGVYKSIDGGVSWSCVCQPDQHQIRFTFSSSKRGGY